MRREAPSDGWLGTALEAVVVASGVAVGGVAAAWPGAGAGAALGLGGAWLLRRRRRRSRERRGRALALPFPESWREILRERCDHYDRLPPELKGRFEDDLRIFLLEKRITGVGVEVTDEQRLLVACSAVTLSLGWPDHEWDRLTEVLLYPEDFDRDYGFEKAELAGQAHPWGTVILSVPALLESFDDPDDAYHVGFHEMAHLLDLEQTRFEGIPAGLDEARAGEWVALAEKEMERLRRHKSVLDEYGSEDPVEFFAVAVEAFFEASLALRRRHRELYSLLSGYFLQDPAAWDDARGLKL